MAGLYFRGVHCALGVEFEIVKPIKLSWLASAAPPWIQRFEGFPIEHPDLLVCPVRDVQVPLGRIERIKRDLPSRSGAVRLRGKTVSLT